VEYRYGSGGTPDRFTARKEGKYYNGDTLHVSLGNLHPDRERFELAVHYPEEQPTEYYHCERSR
jgi:hypothetical protein